MTIARTLERRVLGVARLLCLVAFAIALCGVVAVVVALFSGGPVRTGSDTAVPASEVLAAIPGSERANDVLPDDETPPSMALSNAAGLIIPSPLQTVLFGDAESQPVLDSWLGQVPGRDRQ